MEKEIITHSTEETLLLASKIAPLLCKGDVVLLEGNLGAGKTCFVKGIGKTLDIKETITSPTFNIVRCYFEGRLPLYHIDAYRLEGIRNDIGLEEYLYGDGVCIVEWSEFISYLLPESCLKIKIEIIDLNTRIFKLISNDDHYNKIIEGVR